jgi:hypothetical protein
MAALSAATSPPYEHASRFSWTQTFRVVNSDIIYAGALCGLPGTNALTSGRGYLHPWQDQINIQWAGIAEAQSWTGGILASARTGTTTRVNSVLGDTSATPVPEISVEMGPVVLKNVTVTGVSAQTDLWRTLLYSNTDNYTDLSTTASTYAPAIGKVLYWYSSTEADVALFGALRMTNIS